MSTIIQDLNDCEPKVLTIPDAVAVARQPHITRYVQSDFGWAEIRQGDLCVLLHGLEAGTPISVRKEPKFAIYYFSKP